MATSCATRSSRIAETIRKNPYAKGLAVIIGNQYSCHPQLKNVLSGPPKDVETMRLTMRRLHYAVVPLCNVSHLEMKQLVEDIKTYFPREGKASDDCYQRLVFVFAGHGDIQDRLHCKEGYVHLKSEIIIPLLPHSCKNLQHIPKMFFIDACRADPIKISIRGGPEDNDPDHQHIRYPKLANYYLVQSTQLSEVAIEFSNGGCWLQQLAEELQNPANTEKNHEGIMISVNRNLNYKLQTEPLRQMIQDSKEVEDDFLQLAMSTGTLFSEVFFIKEAKAFEDKHRATMVGCLDSSPTTQPSQAEPSHGSNPTSMSSGATLSSTATKTVKQLPLCESPLATTNSANKENCQSRSGGISAIEQLERAVAENDDTITYDPAREQRRGRYIVKVTVSGLGHVDGEPCRNKQHAKESAAQIALDLYLRYCCL